MAQKWYQKASVQTALVGGAFLLAATFIGIYWKTSDAPTITLMTPAPTSNPSSTPVASPVTVPNPNPVTTPTITPSVQPSLGLVSRPESSPRERPSVPVLSAAVEAKKQIAALDSELQKQIEQGGLFDFSDPDEAEEKIKTWTQTNAYIASRIDDEMKRAYGVETNYRREFGAAASTSIYVWSRNDQRQEEMLRSDVTKQLRKLSALRGRVRRDTFRYSGDSESQQ